MISRGGEVGGPGSRFGFERVVNIRASVRWFGR